MAHFGTTTWHFTNLAPIACVCETQSIWHTIWHREAPCHIREAIGMREYGTTASVRKRSRGKWQAVVWYRDEGAEKWRQLTKLTGVRCYPDKDGKANNRGKKAAQREAEAWRMELLEAEPARSRAEDLEAAGELTGRSTVSEHVARYIDTLEAVGKVEPSTAGTYRRMADLIDRGANPRTGEATPGLGSLPVEDLTPGRVQAWLNGLVRRYGNVTNVHKALTLLRGVCSRLEAQGVIGRDPTRDVMAPRAEAQDPNTITPEDMARLMADLAEPRKREQPQTVIGILIALYTGMRRGEVCGLQWGEVDLEAGTLRVARAIGIGGDQRTYVKAPKTAKSRREVPIPAPLAEALALWRAEYGAKCRAAGERLRPGLYVCGDVDGSYLDPRKLWRAFKRRIDRLGIVGTQGRPPTFHDLRHTWATTAIRAGADVKSVSSLMGHSNAAMTLNVYASADAEAKRRAVERVAEAMGPIAGQILPEAAGRPETGDEAD